MLEWFKKRLAGGAVAPTVVRRRINDYYFLDADLSAPSLAAGSTVTHGTNVYTYTSPDVDTKLASVKVQWTNATVLCASGKCLDPVAGTWVREHEKEFNTWVYGDWGRHSEGWRSRFETVLHRNPGTQGTAPAELMAEATVESATGRFPLSLVIP